MNVNIQTPMFQYSVYLNKEAISCLEYLLDNQGNVIVFADSYDVGPTGSLNFYRISSSEGKNIKIPIYSVPSHCWITVVLVTEDQRQVLFEEDPSFDYEFDDLDFIRNRSLKNPLFNDNQDEDNFSLPSIPNNTNSNGNSALNPQNISGVAPVINIQNILPENMGQQTVVQQPLNQDTGRISITDEQMNGLLSSIDKLANLFVQQQNNFNMALELQGQQLLQLQPIIAKIASASNIPSTPQKEVKPSNVSNVLNDNKSLNELLKKIPKNISPLMPNLYSGNSFNLNEQVSSLSLDKKPIDTKKHSSAIQNNRIQTSTSIEKTEEDKQNHILETSSIASSITALNPESHPSIDTPEIYEDTHNHDNKLDIKHIDEYDVATTQPEILDLDTQKASTMEELLISLGHKEPNSSIVDDTHNIDEQTDNTNLNEEINLNEATNKNEDKTVPAISIDDINDDDDNELSDEDLAILNEINKSNSNDELADADIKNLVSAIDVIQSDENDFEDELKEIVNETNELINSKDVLHFKETENTYNPSGALEHEEDMLSQLNAQAEDILSRKDEYLEKDLEVFEPNDVVTTPQEVETVTSNVSESKQTILNTDTDNDDEDSDDLSNLLNTMDKSSQEIEFEPIPDDDDEDSDEEDDSSSGSSGDSTSLTPNISNDENPDIPTQENTTSNIDNTTDSDELDIYALLDSDNGSFNNSSGSNSDNNQPEPPQEEDLSILDEVIAKKSANTVTLQPSQTVDDFSLESLDDLEALIEPPSKKGKNKTKLTVDDSDNQDEFVSSQILSYVFSDLDEDTAFEVDDFLKYFEQNNLHKAFGKITKDKTVYLVCKLLKNKNASPSKFVRAPIQKKLKTIMPDVAKEHWTGSISNIMDVFEEEKLLDGVNEIDICVWFVKNNFF